MFMSRTVLYFGLVNLARALDLFNEISTSSGKSHVFTNDQLADHQLRVGATNGSICDGNEGIAGYVDIAQGDKHLFFWAFESRNDPPNDPVILWMTGGPGCSGVGFGALVELGPCIIQSDGELKNNPWSWTSNATVIFVDQPVNVGMSYSSQPVETLDAASVDMHRFLQLLHYAFPRLSQLPFYIAAESYGGHWAPALAAHIHESQYSPMGLLAQTAFWPPLEPINLQGVILGNVGVNEPMQWNGFWKTGCEGPAPLFNASICADMAQSLPRCQKLLQICNEDFYDMEVCGPALSFCRLHSTFLLSIVHPTKNPYNFKKECYEPSTGTCYKVESLATAYLNRPDVQTELGVDEGHTFAQCNMSVNTLFTNGGETNRPANHYINYLLDSGISILVYVGQDDWFCNPAGMRLLVDGFVWEGMIPFREAETHSWYVRVPKTHGSSRTKLVKMGKGKVYGPLTYLEVPDSGHMVPRDRPAEALGMLKAWLAGTLQLN